MRSKAILFLGLLFLVFSAPALAAPLRIVALGDSLTAGYGLTQGDEYPAQLQTALRGIGVDAVVENAGVTGDTTAGGLARVEWATGGDIKPRLVLVALGANDMLRGINPTVTKENLHGILNYLKQKQIPAVLIGMRVTLNLPLMFRSSYDSMYKDLAEEFDVPLYPFLLDGVAMDPNLNIDDGIHPNKAGVAIMVKRSLPTVLKALKK